MPLRVLAEGNTPADGGGLSDEDDIRSYITNTPWYNPNDTVCSLDGSSITNVPDSENIEDRIKSAFSFFVSKGLTSMQAAAILGNLRQESQVNPASNNTAARPTDIDPGSIIPGETWNGGGIAQWEGGRWTGSAGLLNFVAGKAAFDGHPQGDGTNWKTLSAQLNFMWGELTGFPDFPNAGYKRPGLDELKAAATIEDATTVFEEKFEGAGIPRMENRIAYAKEVFDKYGSGGGGPVGPTGCSTSLANGSVNVNGYAFPLAPQTKKDYGGEPCNAGPSTYTNKYGVSFRIQTCHHDGTPAADIMDGDGGSAVYALTKGTIASTSNCYSMSGDCVPGCSEIQFHADNGTDHYYYWYGHLKNVTVKTGQEVTAGQQIAQTATREFGYRCWGGGPHVHIDRGCVNPSNNEPQHGGYVNCREPSFLNDLRAIWEGLPS
jgi:hypothetical protein